MPIKPEVRRIFKNCADLFDCLDPRNLSAKFKRNRYGKSTQLGNFAAEIGELIRASFDWLNERLDGLIVESFLSVYFDEN